METNHHHIHRCDLWDDPSTCTINRSQLGHPAEVNPGDELSTATGWVRVLSIRNMDGGSARIRLADGRSLVAKPTVRNPENLVRFRRGA